MINNNSSIQGSKRPRIPLIGDNTEEIAIVPVSSPEKKMKRAQILNIAHSNYGNVSPGGNSLLSPTTRFRSDTSNKENLREDSLTPLRPGILTASTPKSKDRMHSTAETPKSDFMSFVENVLSPIVIGVSPLHSMSPHDGSQIPISSRFKIYTFLY